MKNESSSLSENNQQEQREINLLPEEINKLADFFLVLVQIDQRLKKEKLEKRGDKV